MKSFGEAIAPRLKSIAASQSRYNDGVLVYSGSTVHVVPTELGSWAVVDLQRHWRSFPSKAAALVEAKRTAAAHQPSQVVLFTATGHTETVAHYQLPQYRIPDATAQGDNGSLFESTVKALVIGGIVTAGVPVLHHLVDTEERDLKRELARSKPSQRRNRRLQVA